jgi:outer membrane murein-binding lipoprotein Lpp
MSRTSLFLGIATAVASIFVAGCFHEFQSINQFAKLNQLG